MGPASEVLPDQQLPEPSESHQKSTPLGCFSPPGVSASRFVRWWLLFDVSYDNRGSVSLRNAAGTHIWKTPARQLSKYRLPSTLSKLPPAMIRPVPTGERTDGQTTPCSR